MNAVVCGGVRQTCLKIVANKIRYPFATVRFNALTIRKNFAQGSLSSVRDRSYQQICISFQLICISSEQERISATVCEM